MWKDELPILGVFVPDTQVCSTYADAPSVHAIAHIHTRDLSRMREYNELVYIRSNKLTSRFMQLERIPRLLYMHPANMHDYAGGLRPSYAK